MPGRRLLGYFPQLERRAWEDVAPELSRFLRRLFDSENDGIPAGFLDLTPTTVEQDEVSSPGTEITGWAASNHDHPVATTAAVGLGNASAEGTGSELARADHVHKRDVRIKSEGADVGTRNALNFVDSPSVDFQPADDAGNDRVNLTAVVLTSGVNHPFRTETANYTVQAADEIILGDATSGAITISLPTAAAAANRILRVKKIDSSVNIVKVDPDGAETIDGAADFDLTAQHEVIEFGSDGTDWWIL